MLILSTFLASEVTVPVLISLLIYISFLPSFSENFRRKGHKYLHWMQYIYQEVLWLFIQLSPFVSITRHRCLMEGLWEFAEVHLVKKRSMVWPVFTWPSQELGHRLPPLPWLASLCRRLGREQAASTICQFLDNRMLCLHRKEAAAVQYRWQIADCTEQDSVSYLEWRGTWKERRVY